MKFSGLPNSDNKKLHKETLFESRLVCLEEIEMKGILLLICAVIAHINAQFDCGCSLCPLPLCPRPPLLPRPRPPCPCAIPCPPPCPPPCSPPIPTCPRPLPPCPRPLPPCPRPLPLCPKPFPPCCPCEYPAPIIEICDYNQAKVPFIQPPLLQQPPLQPFPPCCPCENLAPIIDVCDYNQGPVLLPQPIVSYDVPYSVAPSCNCPAPPSLPVSQLYPFSPVIPPYCLDFGLSISPCLGGVADWSPLLSPVGMINPFLPAASPISALAPTVSSLYPPINPCGCGCLFLKKIPIPPPCI